GRAPGGGGSVGGGLGGAVVDHDEVDLRGKRGERDRQGGRLVEGGQDDADPGEIHHTGVYEADSRTPSIRCLQSSDNRPPGGPPRPLRREGPPMRQPAVPSRQEQTTDPAFARASAAAAVTVLAIGTLGPFYLRFRAPVPWRVPSVPYWYSFPFYLFPHRHLALAWALRATPVIALAVAGVLALHRSHLRW